MVPDGAVRRDVAPSGCWVDGEWLPSRDAWFLAVDRYLTAHPGER